MLRKAEREFAMRIIGAWAYWLEYPVARFYRDAPT